MNIQTSPLPRALSIILAVLLSPPRVERLRTIDAELKHLREEVSRWNLGENLQNFRAALTEHFKDPSEETLEILAEGSEVMHRDPLVKRRWKLLKSAANETLWAYYLAEAPPIFTEMLEEAMDLIAEESAKVKEHEATWLDSLDPWRSEAAKYGCAFVYPPSVADHLSTVSLALDATIRAHISREGFKELRGSISSAVPPPSVAEVLAVFGLELPAV